MSEPQTPEQINAALVKAGVIKSPPRAQPKATFDDATASALRKAGALAPAGYQPPKPSTTPQKLSASAGDLSKLSAEDRHVAKLLGNDLAAVARHKSRSSAAPVAPVDDGLQLVELSARTRVGGNCPHPSSIKMMDGSGELARFCGACGRHQGRAA